VAAILLEVAPGSSRNYIVDGSGERPPFLGNYLKKAAAILWDFVPGSGAILWELAPETGHYFMAVGSRERPPFYGSWLQ
jgi:hypothetical protein